MYTGLQAVGMKVVIRGGILMGICFLPLFDLRPFKAPKSSLESTSPFFFHPVERSLLIIQFLKRYQLLSLSQLTFTFIN